MGKFAGSGRLILGLAGLCAVIISAPFPVRADQEGLREEVEAALTETRNGWSSARYKFEDLRAFYEARNYRPIWFGDTAERRSRLDALIGVLRSAPREGLHPGHYNVDRLMAAHADGRDLEVERRATRALLDYAFDLREGRVAAHQGDPAVHVTGEQVGPAKLLHRFTAAEEPSRFFSGLAPANPHYRRLRRALADYRSIAAAGGWPQIPDGPTLRRGDTSPRVRALHARLAASDDISVSSPNNNVFGEGLHEAVVRFQRRLGLDTDGAVGPKTLAALNIPVEARIEQIVLNMERWRWFPDDLGDQHVLVNLAGFELEVVEAGSVVMDMRVVVGRPYRQTPAFSDRITYLEFNPTWTIPPGILRHDILPKLREDPRYLAENDMRLYPGWADNAPAIDPVNVDWTAVDPKRIPYRIVQSPGPKNALGRVKFMFPNRFNVYLHDTPSRELFTKTQRVFSSGCIRVEKPLELAEYLLKVSPGWSRQRIDAVVQSGRRTTASLSPAVPIHLIYATTWIGEGGTVHFRPDVYGRDARLRNALENASRRSVNE